MTTGSTAQTSIARVGVLRLAHGKDLPLPTYHSTAAAGLDLIAALDWDHPLTLTPGARALIPTGLILELPAGFEAQVRPRSGLALKHGVTVLNSPGTIDADYRGEVSVLLANLSGVPFEIRRGERIAQLVIAPVTRAELVEVLEVGDTERGSGGFGSTGRAVEHHAATLEAAKATPQKPAKARAPAKAKEPAKAKSKAPAAKAAPKASARAPSAKKKKKT